MDLQLQLRANALELQDYMQDLYSWEKTVAKRDKELKKGVDRTTAAPSAPPVRGRAAAVTSEPPKELQAISPALSAGGAGGVAAPGASGVPGKRRVRRKKIKAGGGEGAKGKEKTAAHHTYDRYRDRWDRFDVDAALKEASDSSEYDMVTEDESEAAAGPGGPPGHLTEVSTTRGDAAAAAAAEAAAEAKARSSFAFGPAGAKRELPPVRQAPPRAKEPETAAEWKDRGNERFKSYQYEEAAECYTRSLALEETAASFANRAMAWLKLAAKDPAKASERYRAAEADCTAALALDPTHIKSYQRRGVARDALGRPLDAALDLEEALRLEPASSAILSERDSAWRRGLEGAGPGMAAVVVSDFAVPVSVRQPPPQEATPAPRPLIEAIPIPAASSTSAVPVAPSSDQHPQHRPVQQQQTSEEAGPEGPATPAASSAITQVVPAAPEPSQPAKDEKSEKPSAAALSSAVIVPPSMQTAAQRAAAAMELMAQKRSASALKVPSTATEFETAWKSFRGDTKAQESYLRAIPPESLPLVFKSSLTAQTLTAVASTALSVAAAGGAGDADFGAAVLDNLTRVPRFAMTAMGVPSRDRAALGGLFDGAVAVGGEGAARIAAVRQQFRA